MKNFFFETGYLRIGAHRCRRGVGAGAGHPALRPSGQPFRVRRKHAAGLQGLLRCRSARFRDRHPHDPRRRAGDLARRDAGTSDALQARGGDDDGRRDPQGQDQPGQRPDLPARAGGLLRRQGQRIHRVRNEDEAGRELSRRAAARVLREGVQHGDGQETRQLALSVHVE